MLTKEGEKLAEEMADNILDGLNDLVEACLKGLREQENLSPEMEKHMRVYLTRQARFVQHYK
jgi:hypothetical protein